jgi:DNA-binding beta-propeller fold protein YncE
MTRIHLWALPALFVLLSGGGGAADADAPAYKVQKTIKVGGDGSWDYLTMDADARRLYISRATRVIVLDVDSGKVVGEVAKTPGIHGIALAPKHKRGFTSNGGEATVTVFDLETLRETARVKVGTRPDAILYDPATDRVFTFNAGSKDSTAIDAKDNTVAGTIKLDGKPEFAVADEKGMIYVNIEDKNEIVAIDSKKLEVKSRWSLAPGEKPSGLAMDRAKRRLYSTCGNQKMIIMDADSGKVLGTAEIGKGTDACAFDPGVGLAFSSNRDGTLTVVEEKPEGKWKAVANVKTQEGSKTMALDTKTHNILLAGARFKPGAGRRTVEPDSFVVLVVGK